MNAPLLSLLAAALAGVASTLLELWWFRQASVALPGTLPAMALVVPSFLAAWTLGSLLAGRLVDRSPAPLVTAARWFAAAGLAALAMPRLLDLFLPALPPTGLAGKLLVGALPAAPAALLLAGAMPLLSAVRRRAGLGAQRAAGGVGCAVALGGVVGCALLPTLALAPTGVALPAAAVLAAAALLCTLLHVAVGPLATGAPGGAARTAEGAVRRGAGGRTAPTGPRRLAFDPDDAVPWGGVRIWVLLGGALLVAGQLALLRLFVQWHGDSLVSGAEVLGGLHVGMALGAGVLAWMPRAVPPGLLLAGGLSLAGAGLAVAPRWLPPPEDLSPALLALLLLAPLGAGAGSLVTAASRGGRRGGAAHGATPRAAELRGGAARPASGSPAFGSPAFGSWIGDLAALSTLGGLAGGAWFVWWAAPDPDMGTPGALRLCALTAAAAGCAAALLTALRAGLPPGTRLLSASAVLVAALVGLEVVDRPAAELPWRAARDETGLLVLDEGLRGVVSLVRTRDGGRRLKRDFLVGLGGDSSAPLDRRMGRLAAAFAPDAERALLLGVGLGHTLAGLAEITPARVEGLEHDDRILALELPVPLRPGVLPPGGRPQRLHAEARAFLAAHPDTYDLIVGDLFVPWITGAGDLLNPDRFAIVRRALTDGGVYVQWLPLHQLPWDAFGPVVEAFREVFPDVRLFVATPLADVPLVALVGGLNLLPDPAAVDALLGASPSPEGPNDMGDVFDSYVTDAWSLRARFSEHPANSRDRPWSELRSMRRHHDEAFLARTNIGLLGTLVQALDASSLASTPPDEKERRELGVELTARAAALQALLLARAGQLELQARADVPVADVDAWMLPEERDALDQDVNQALLRAWAARPGDRGVRSALEQRCVQLGRRDLHGAAGSLLESALAVAGDGRLAGAYGGVLLAVGEDARALDVLLLAEAAAPDDRTVLLHLGSALVRNGRDDEARAALRRARELPPRHTLPALQDVVLGVLEGRADAVDAARRMLTALDPDQPWAPTLRRLLDRADAGGAGG